MGSGASVTEKIEPKVPNGDKKVYNDDGTVERQPSIVEGETKHQQVNPSENCQQVQESHNAIGNSSDSENTEQQVKSETTDNDNEAHPDNGKPKTGTASLGKHDTPKDSGQPSLGSSSNAGDVVNSESKDRTSEATNQSVECSAKSGQNPNTGSNSNEVDTDSRLENSEDACNALVDNGHSGDSSMTSPSVRQAQMNQSDTKADVTDNNSDNKKNDVKHHDAELSYINQTAVNKRNNGQDSGDRKDKMMKPPESVKCPDKSTAKPKTTHDDNAVKKTDGGNAGTAFESKQNRNEQGKLSTENTEKPTSNTEANNQPHNSAVDKSTDSGEKKTEVVGNEEIKKEKNKGKASDQNSIEQTNEKGAKTASPKPQPPKPSNGKIDNLRFYKNEIPSKPSPGGCKIEEMLRWKGDYDTLEKKHQYIQWLFPIEEGPGLNSSAQALEEHEAWAISTDSHLRKRVMRAYKMMLDFYGMELFNETTGEIKKNKNNWKERFAHLNKSRHNYLRITRIIKSLGELGFEHFQFPLVKFIMEQAFNTKDLAGLDCDSMNYWINAVQDADTHLELQCLYLKLKPDKDFDSNKGKKNTPTTDTKSPTSNNVKNTPKKEKGIALDF